MKAVIDRRRAGDVTSEIPIQVASRPDQYAAWAERPATVAGDTKELPFRIEIPADQPPSFQAASNSMRWFLEGVASRRLRDDFNVRAELNIHGAQAAKT